MLSDNEKKYAMIPAVAARCGRRWRYPLQDQEKEEVMGFLGELCKEDSVRFKYNGVDFWPSEIRVHIGEGSQIGESLYRKVELVYREVLGARGKPYIRNPVKRKK